MKPKKILPFTYEWWMAVSSRAYEEAENFAFRTYMYDVIDYYQSRAIESLFNHKVKWKNQ